MLLPRVDLLFINLFKFLFSYVLVYLLRVKYNKQHSNRFFSPSLHLSIFQFSSFRHSPFNQISFLFFSSNRTSFTSTPRSPASSSSSSPLTHFHVTSCSCLKFRLHIIFIIYCHRYRSPKRDSNLGLNRIAIFEDCKASALTTQATQLVICPYLSSTKIIHAIWWDIKSSRAKFWQILKQCFP